MGGDQGDVGREEKTNKVVRKHKRREREEGERSRS